MSDLVTEESITITDIFPYEDSDAGAEHRTHIINPPDNMHIWHPGMEISEVVQIARITQQPVKCLCGFLFVPSRDPERYDACEKCVEVAGELMRGAGE